MLNKNVKNTMAFVCLAFLIIVRPAGPAAADGKQDALHAAEEMRQSYREMIPLAGPGDAVREVRDISVQAAGPAREIPLRVYFPLREKQRTNPPVFLFIHGGGFVSGDLDTHDVLLRAVANGAGCIVVSVGYRLAPENPFPAGLEDVYTALLWVRGNAASLGGDGARIVVGGDSAGGNLAAALALLSRDRNGPRLLGQWLMYPTVSNKMDTASWAALGDKYFPTREINSAVIAAYVPEGKSPYDPLIAPLWAGLENLPPALIQVGGLDPLSDECGDFARKLEKNGGEVVFLLYPEYQHGFLQFYKDGKTFPGAESALKQGLDWLREVFAR